MSGSSSNQRLQEWVKEAIAEGWLAEWCYGFPLWSEGTLLTREPGHPRFVPLNGMSELPKRLATGLIVATGSPVIGLTRNPDGTYTAQTEEGKAFSGRSLILNLPPVQLLNLARNLLSPEMAADISAVRFLPAWALLLRLDGDIPGVDWPAVEFSGHPVLSWIARDHTRREANSPPVLVVHGSGPWSEAHLEENPNRVQEILQDAAVRVLGPLGIRESLIHRWRYALPVDVHPSKSIWDAERRIGICGDWCDGPRVEGAIESGWHLAKRV